jgi:hypothetical protein
MKAKFFLLFIITAILGCSAEESTRPSTLTVDNEKFSPSPNKADQNNRTVLRTMNPENRVRTETYELTQRGTGGQNDIVINLSVYHHEGGRVQGTHEVMNGRVKGFLMLNGQEHQLAGGYMQIKYLGANTYEFFINIAAKLEGNASDYKNIHGYYKAKLKEL